ncbi:hypothetical protein D3C87_1290390 [compost metagenome]
MPVQQSIKGQGFGETLRGVEHELRQPLTAFADLVTFIELQPQSSRQGRANRTDIQLFAFYRGRGDDVLQQRIQLALGTE